MAPKQFQLDGPSLDDLKARILAEHGARARIISAEKVRVGGVWGFFAREHYEVTVEVPERIRRGAHVLLDMPARAGIAALLDDAESAEADIQGADPSLSVSTGSDSFAELMDDLTFNTAPAALSGAARAAGAPGAPAAAPQEVRPTGRGPVSGSGDLVVVLGLGDDALTVARSMAARAGNAVVRTAGSLVIDGVERVQDRQSAMAARASGVATGQATFVAFGLERADRDAAGCSAVLQRIGADQLWLAVNAGRKPDDTARWVDAVKAAMPVEALAVLGCDSTSSPSTVTELGLPAGWVDGDTAAAGA